jgi:hypothetical protein
VALVDIDKNFTLQQLLQDPFYLKYGSGFYTTPSHTNSNHRFRIIHILENPITNVKEMEFLLRGLIELYGSDKACKDGCRLFYGTINATHSDFTGKTLPQEIVDSLVLRQCLLEKENIPTTEISYEPQTDVDKARTISALKEIFLGNYEEWKRVAIALYNSGYNLEDFQQATINGMMKNKTQTDCKTLWNDCHRYKKVSFGSIVHLLKEHNKLPKPSTKVGGQRGLAIKVGTLK